MSGVIVPGSPQSEQLMETLRKEHDRRAAAAGHNVIAPADENDAAVKLLRLEAERTAPPSRLPAIDADAVRQMEASLPPLDPSIADAIEAEAERMGGKT